MFTSAPFLLMRFLSPGATPLANPHLPPPMLSHTHPLFSERDLCYPYSPSKWGNQYLNGRIWIPSLTVCPQLGQFMWAENRHRGHFYSIAENTEQKERLKGKNWWQVRPNRVAVTVQPELGGEMSWGWRGQRRNFLSWNFQGPQGCGGRVVG